MNKILLATVAMATVIASPTLAQTKHRHVKHPAANPLAAYATPINRTGVSRHSPNPAYDVYVNGYYMGSDPDPLIRMQLQRDVGAYE